MKFKSIFIFSILVLLTSFFVMGANCDYSKYEEEIERLESLNKKLTKINNSYWPLLEKYNDLNNTFHKIREERDFYKNSYFNSSISNMTVRDFYMHMENIENNYQSLNTSVNNRITKFSKKINWNIGLTITLFSVTLLGIFSCTIIFFKHLKQNFGYFFTKLKSEIISNENKKGHKKHKEK